MSAATPTPTSTRTSTRCCSSAACAPSWTAAVARRVLAPPWRGVVGITMAHRNPLIRRAVLGLAAGAAGTLALDLVWYRRARKAGSDAGFAEWEIVRDLQSWDDAPAPGK